MKSNRKCHKSVVLIVVMTTLELFSCQDYLDRYPLNNPSDATFLSTGEELNMALTGCYNGLVTISYGLYKTPFSLILDAATDVNWTRTGDATLGKVAVDSRNGEALALWTGFYQGIAKCNYLIANMDRAKEKVDAETFNQIKAEARFLRALYYHYLVELYGGVPLVTEPITLGESQVPRKTKGEVVDFILTELDECSLDLPVENDPTSGRATKGAAWALQSRVALYNERWNDAIDAAQKVMQLEGSQYIIDPDYADLFQYEGQESREIFFSIQYLKGLFVHSLFMQHGSRNAATFSNWAPTYQTADSWECTDGLQIDESPLFNPQSPFENRDPRLGYTIALPGSVFLGFQFETHGDSTMCWDYNQNPPRRISNQEATNAYATFTGLLWRKYTDIEDRPAGYQSDLNIILIRYAEVLLNYAEAKIEAGSIDQSVYDAINKVRQRPSVNMPPITAMSVNDLRHAVRRERKYELTGEGLRLFDIRRWKIAENVMNLPILGRMKKGYPSVAPEVDEDGTVYYDNIPIASQGESNDFKMRVVETRTFDKDKDYLWPIPYIEMNTNSAMEQNPGFGDDGE